MAESVAARLGRGIHALRRSRGWEQRELARQSGVSQSIINRIESGHAQGLTVENAYKLMFALRGSLDEWTGLRDALGRLEN